MATKIIDKDNGYKKFMKEMLKFTKKPYVKIGLLSKKNQRENSELTNAEIAVIHEFGAPMARIPERSFLRSTFDEKNREWARITSEIVKKVDIRLMSTSEGLSLLGLTAVNDVKSKLRKGPFVPLSPITIKRRTGNSIKPLIDTAQMINSITFEKLNI